MWSMDSEVEHCGRKRVVFSARARLVELVLVALVGFGSKGVALIRLERIYNF
jgi:hypothetical protein